METVKGVEIYAIERTDEDLPPPVAPLTGEEGDRIYNLLVRQEFGSGGDCREAIENAGYQMIERRNSVHILDDGSILQLWDLAREGESLVTFYLRFPTTQS